jgi:hypothetical protein
MTRCELLGRMAATPGAFVFTVLAKAAIPIELGRSRLRPQPASPR